MANQAGGPISVPVAITLGLIASFVQSLGLTIQRKSHLQNEALLAPRRRTQWKRPLWLIGFAIFLCANIGGTVFQIGALPIVMLAPLGAVSLLYNALLARFLLNDFLSKYMIMGTLLIATGAVLIGYFGVVPSPPHDLDDLLDLYGQPTFVAFATIFTFLFIGVLAISHLAEWQLYARIHRSSLPPPRPKPKQRNKSRLRRRWSVPSLAPVAEVSESNSGISTPVLAIADETARNGQTVQTLGRSSGHAVATEQVGKSGKRDYGAISRGQPSSVQTGGRPCRRGSQQLELRGHEDRINAETVKRTKLGLSVAYGGASGTMSGACLLLAKSGVELLLLTFSGQNQLARWQSWMLILILLAAALAQLWYLNKALKLSDPTLVCPLAFCFYNTSSIALGLVYFDQLGALAWYDILAVAIGTAVLLTGVWIVSLHGSDREDGDGEEGEETTSLLSSLKTEGSHVSTTEEAEGLLANAAGIAGPHLPSPGLGLSSDSSSGSSISIETHLSSPEAFDITSPLPSSPTKSRPSMRKRTSSAGHRRRPTITLDFPMNTEDQQEEDLKNQGARRQHGFYNTILEHGLSIGISPSSPGFYLQPPRSPSLQRIQEPWRQHARRHPRRTMSEADVAPLQELATAEASPVELANEEASSGFAILVDQSALSR